MRQVLHTGRSSACAVLAVAMLLGLMPAGCGDDAGKPNLPPTVTLIEFPDPGTPVTTSTRFAWIGSDPDGEIVTYEYTLDAEEGYTAVTDTFIVLAFDKADGTESNPLAHVFRVRAVDDRSLAGTPAAGHFTVGYPNDQPSVNFTRRPPSAGYAGPTVTFGWIAEDGDGTIVGYEYQNVTGDTTSGGWIATADTTVSFDFSGDGASPGARRWSRSPLNRYQQYAFYLRAIDDENKRSNVIRAPYTSGPENLAPSVVFVDRPSDPVTGLAHWSWLGTDNDGGILRYQWAFDLTSDADWQSLGPDVTSFNRTFTRQEGSDQVPRDYTFHLRAQDSDSTYSAPITHAFTVAVPNSAPTVSFTQVPSPGALVGYIQTIKWRGTDDVAVTGYEYSLEDTLTWVQIAAAVTTRDFVFTCAETTIVSATPNPSAPLGTARGRHTIYLRSIDDEGARSAAVNAGFTTQTVTPYTTIQTPIGSDGAVTGTASFHMTWTGTDVDRANRLPVGYAVQVTEILDLGTLPDAQVAVMGSAEPWVDLADGIVETTLQLVSGKSYLVAVRSRDEAQAVEPYFHYGRNVLKVTVP